VPPVVSRAARRATLRTHRSMEKLGLLSVSMDCVAVACHQTRKFRKSLQ
jgi:hypothetical protein